MGLYMFRTRLLSGIVLVLIAAGGIAAGGYVWGALLCLVSMVAYYELMRATAVHTEGKKLNAIEITGLVLTVIYYLTAFYLSDDFLIFSILGLSVYLIAVFIVFMFIYVVRFPEYKAVQFMEAFFEFVYAPVMLSFLYALRLNSSGRLSYALGLIFICSWGSDTCAYCVGVLFGKHKMTPKLSPKKTIEGAIGGIAGAALLSVLYTRFVVNVLSVKSFNINILSAIIIGAVGAVISMIGDLTASAIKRDYNIKDYGNLIPGHGGIMDRFDSVIIVTPFIFFWFCFGMSF